MNITQARALVRVFRRTPLYAGGVQRGTVMPRNNYDAAPGRADMTWREFKALAIDGHDCVLVPWCGMWLGIEPDGYTHS